MSRASTIGRARRRAPALALAAALAVLGGAPAALAQPDDADAGPTYTIGVYAPWMYFSNSVARSAYAEQLAAALGRVTGLELRGRGYSTASEFHNQINAGQVHFAVVDAQYQIERGLTALAQGVANGRPTRAMVLVAGSGSGVADLEGKRLARLNLGAGDDGFIFNYLLQNQVEPGFFGKGRAVRDVQGALSLVKLGKADAAFAFKGTQPGVFESRPVPLPVFVRTGAPVPGEVVSAVRSAVQGVAIRSPVIDGFTTYRADVQSRLRRALKGRPTGPGNQPIVSRGRPRLPRVSGALAPLGAPAVRLTPVGDALETTPPPADLY